MPGQEVGLATESADAFDIAHELGELLRLDPRELLLGRAFGNETSELFIDRGLDPGEIASGLCGGVDQEPTADLERPYPGIDVSRDLLVIDQALVETGGLAVRQDAGDQ